MKCREVETLWLEDGATRIFLNTHGNNEDEVSEELVALLKYFENSTLEEAVESGSDAIKEIHDHVQKLKDSEEIGVRYMQAWEEKMYERMEAKEEGRLEGLEAGRREGIKALVEDNLEEGVPQKRIIEKLMKRYALSQETAQDYYNRFTE